MNRTCGFNTRGRRIRSLKALLCRFDATTIITKEEYLLTLDALPPVLSTATLPISGEEQHLYLDAGISNLRFSGIQRIDTLLLRIRSCSALSGKHCIQYLSLRRRKEGEQRTGSIIVPLLSAVPAGIAYISLFLTSFLTTLSYTVQVGKS